jgi:outer membrane protein insertion porin family
VVDPETGKGILEVHVDEGPQYRVASFTVEGNRHFPTSQLEAMYRAEEGGILRTLGITGRGRDTDAFDQPGFLDATRRVEELYANQGYIYAQVNPVINPRIPEEGRSGPVVDLVWDVQEGQPAYIRRIHIVGNTFTYDRVIREQINLLPGQVYSQQDILASYQRISGLGFFETPLPFPDVQPDPETGDVDITFEVVERQTGSINFGASMGGIGGVAGFLGYEQPNLFGQAKSGSLRWDFGRFQNNFVLSYTDPALRESRLSGTISIFDSRDRLFSFSSGERKRRGFLTRVGLPLPGALYTRLFAGYSLSRTEYRLAGGVDDTSLFGRPPGTQSQLSLTLRRSTLNSPLFPTQGSEQSWTTEFNGGILGGDGDFTRHLAEGTWWMPVGQVGGGEGSRPIVFALGTLGPQRGRSWGTPATSPSTVSGSAVYSSDSSSGATRRRRSPRWGTSSAGRGASDISASETPTWCWGLSTRCASTTISRSRRSTRRGTRGRMPGRSIRPGSSAVRGWDFSS